MSSKKSARSVQKEKELFEAIRVEDIPQIEKLLTSSFLRKGVDVNTQNFWGSTPLMAAAEKRDTKILQVLLKYNPDVNISDQTGETALMTAAKYGNIGIMKLLLENGADITACDDKGQSVLMYLFKYSNVNYKAFKFLADAGVDLVKPDNNGITPLEQFIKESYLTEWKVKNKILRYLIEKGANPNVTDNHNHSLLALAAGQSEDFSIYLIDKGAKCENVDVTTVVQSGKYKLVKKLIEHGANPNYRNQDGQTPVMAAAQKGNLDMLTYLINAKANLDAKDDLSRTVMMYAAVGGHIDTIKFLEEKGLDIHQVDSEGSTPLILAAQYEQTDAVVYLVAKGADINKQNNDGNTAFNLAAAKGKVNVLRCLNDLGADVGIKNNAGETAFLLAAYNKQKEVIEYFHKDGLVQYHSNYSQKETDERIERELKSRTVEQLMALPKEEPALWHKIIALKKLSVLVQLLPQTAHLKIYEQAKNLLKPTEHESLKQLIRQERERGNN